jgi:hypothetical protein
MIPGGFIWPPVDGRVILHEVAQLGISPVRTARGDWWASARGCVFHSAARAIYPDADSGRRALIDWARLHAANVRKISAGRTVVLAAAGDGRYRLWQLVRSEQALRERVSACVASAEPTLVASGLVECAAHLIEARTTLHTQDLRLPCTLWTVSGDALTPPRFVGLMPEVGQHGLEEPTGADLIAREFKPLLRALGHQREDYTHVAASIPHVRGDRDGLAASTLAQLT